MITKMGREDKIKLALSCTNIIREIIKFYMLYFYIRQQISFFRKKYIYRDTSLAYKIFTLVELLIVIAIICILAGLLLPALKKAREMGNQIICSSNLKSIGTAIYGYANDYNGYIVPYHLGGTDLTWEKKLACYLGYTGSDSYDSVTAWVTNSKLNKCPSAKWVWKDISEAGGYYNNYGCNVHIIKHPTSLVVGLFEEAPPSSLNLSSVKTPSLSFILVDGHNAPVITGDWNVTACTTTGTEIINHRHNMNANVLYLDAHVKAFPWSRRTIDFVYTYYPCGRKKLYE